MFSLVFALVTLIHASPAPQTLLVSFDARKAVVLASPEGQLQIFTCRIPRGIVPDLTFNSVGSLDRCRRSVVFGQDTPDNRGLFMQNFENVISNWIQVGSHIHRVSQRVNIYASQTALGFVVAHIGSRVFFKRVWAPSKRAHRIVMRMIETGGFGAAAVMVGASFLNTMSDKDRNTLQRETGPINFAAGPILINSDLLTYDLLKAGVAEAVALTASMNRSK